MYSIFPKLLLFIRHVPAQLLSSCLLLRSPSLLPEPAPLEPGLQVQMEVRPSNADSFVSMFVSPEAGADPDSIMSMDLDPRKPKWAEKNQYGDHVFKSWMFSPEE
jgi:hypothetical protein